MHSCKVFSTILNRKYKKATTLFQVHIPSRPSVLLVQVIISANNPTIILILIHSLTSYGLYIADIIYPQIKYVFVYEKIQYPQCQIFFKCTCTVTKAVVYIVISHSLISQWCCATQHQHILKTDIANALMVFAFMTIQTQYLLYSSVKDAFTTLHETIQRL